ncbi:MAG TPA: COX15/CtaA family protein [Ohtaekwangia sp.]|nr:COX15/CtaA family protein [Ohtaekwangia sp.]
MRSFRKLILATLIAVYLLILVGGIVRSTGAGMGCPDWPKCFGQWVPPSRVEELPANYKEIYAAHRHEKNQRFAKYLSVLGMKETAEKLLADPTVLHENDFNPVKTRIEYMNRVVGVIIGFLIFSVFISSIKFWRFERRLTVVALLSFILVVFQGWIGSIVVSTNLTPWTITAHMFLALVLVAMLIYLYFVASDEQPVRRSGNVWWLLACIAVLLVQIALGTQVREALDEVASRAARENWIGEIGQPFDIHRSFSWIVVLLHVGLIYKLVKSGRLKTFALILILLILGTILTGAGMALYAVPAFLQPVHLLLATVTFGMQFLLLLKLRLKEESVLIDT